MMAWVLLIHLLLRDFKNNCFFNSATAANCRLIVAKNTSRSRNRKFFDLLIKQKSLGNKTVGIIQS
jgi:hypothetical protein